VISDALMSTFYIATCHYDIVEKKVLDSNILLVVLYSYNRQVRVSRCMVVSDPVCTGHVAWSVRSALFGL